MNELTEEELKELLTKDSKTLSSIIVINRTLGSYKRESKFCMIELMKRRASGETFEFEKFIKENVEKHKINLNIPNIKSIKQKFISDILKSIIKDNLFSSSTTNNGDDDENNNENY